VLKNNLSCHATHITPAPQFQTAFPFTLSDRHSMHVPSENLKRLSLSKQQLSNLVRNPRPATISIRRSGIRLYNFARTEYCSGWTLSYRPYTSRTPDSEVCDDIFACHARAIPTQHLASLTRPGAQDIIFSPATHLSVYFKTVPPADREGCPRF
jgi:hypothetical protein